MKQSLEEILSELSDPEGHEMYSEIKSKMLTSTKSKKKTVASRKKGIMNKKTEHQKKSKKLGRKR